MPQFAQQRGLVPEAEGEVAAVRKVYAVGDQDVEVDVWPESRPEGLHGHDDPWSGLVPLLPAVAMASNLSGHPASEDAVDHTSDLAMQAGVQLEPLAQTHLLGQCHHQVAVVALWQLLGQRMAQDLRPAIDATGTHAGFARKWHCHMDLALGAMQ